MYHCIGKILKYFKFRIHEQCIMLTNVKKLNNSNHKV